MIKKPWTTKNGFCCRGKIFKIKLWAVVYISGTFFYLFFSAPSKSARHLDLHVNIDDNDNGNKNLNVSFDCHFNKNSSRIFSPPFSTADCESIKSLKMTLNSSTKSKSNQITNEILSGLSDVIQNQLARLQNSTDCLNGGYTLHCGHFEECGFGCEVHHRVACIAVSYAMGIPLIHDSKTAWPYSDPWEVAFLPLGSTHCHVNKNTIHLKWKGLKLNLLRFKKSSSKKGRKRNKKSTEFEFPCKFGIPVAKEVGILIQENTKDPFLWLVGQFTKFIMKLSKKQEKFVNDAMQKMELESESSRSKNEAVVGFHVRRTDKITEIRNSVHHIREYMKEAAKYFQQRVQTLSSSPNSNANANSNENVNTNVNVNPTVFVASDDHTILFQTREIAKRRESAWKIIGFESNKTHRNQKERKSDLRIILREVMLLSECDFIVCGFASNICRLLLEMESYKNPESIVAEAQSKDRSKRFKTLDDGYKFDVWGFIFPPKLILVDSQHV